MKTKVIYDMANHKYLVGIRKHWWNKWIIDGKQSFESLNKALGYVQQMQNVQDILCIIKRTANR